MLDTSVIIGLESHRAMDIEVLPETGGRVNVNDLWIASIALARRLPVVTQDDDFAALTDIGGPEIIRV